MEEKLTQRGFYFLLGAILSCIITLVAIPKQEPIKVEVHKDSVRVDTVMAKKIESYAPLLTEVNLKNEIKRNNIPHSNIVLAQAKLETGNFTSKLCTKHNNLFGIKKGNQYKKYSHWTKCVEDYSKLISKRYRGGDYFAFLDRIGYAGDPNYINKLKDII